LPIDQRRSAVNDNIAHESTSIKKINLTARGGDPEVVRASVRKRFGDPSVVDKVIELDAAWREGEFALFQLRIFRFFSLTLFSLL